MTLHLQSLDLNARAWPQGHFILSLFSEQPGVTNGRQSATEMPQAWLFYAAASAPQHSTEVSPERVGIAGVLWSTLWRRICVQLGKIHGHSSLFRLQESGLQGTGLFKPKRI